MVKFVDVTNIARWVQREGVENIVTGMAGYLEEDYDLEAFIEALS